LLVVFISTSAFGTTVLRVRIVSFTQDMWCVVVWCRVAPGGTACGCIHTGCIAVCIELHCNAVQSLAVLHGAACLHAAPYDTASGVNEPYICQSTWPVEWNCNQSAHHIWTSL